MKLVLATNNRDKIEEVKAYLKDLQGLSLGEMQDSIAFQEEGQTLWENALQKARLMAEQASHWALGDDTGLFIEALGGRPGVFSSRYAGEGATYEQNVSKLLEEMRDVPDEKRGAFFSCVMALVYSDGREVTVEGRLEGAIIREPRGNHGFGYDPIFYLPDRRCTLAELSLEEKNNISHRGWALLKMRGILEGMLKLENSKLLV